MGLENLKNKYNNDKEIGEIQSPIVGKSNNVLNFPIQEQLSDNFISDIANTLNNTKAYNKDSYDNYAKYNTYLNSNSTQEELDKERARNQSNWEKFGRSIEQLVTDEIILGTLKGFGDIFDSIVNIRNPYNDYSSAYTDFFQKLQDENRERFEIYRENPNKPFDWGDFGWWANGFVTIGSTLSLMLPALGGTKLISAVGKASGLSRGINRGLTAAAKFAKFKHPNYFAKEAQFFGKSMLTATLSRTAENYQEGQQTYKQIYQNSLDTLNNYTDEDYARLIDLHPEYAGLNNEEIAKRLATQGANETVKNDMALLAIDILQYHSLGKLLKGIKLTNWGKVRNQIAERNIKAKLAGAADDVLESEKFGHIAKEYLKYNVTHPMDIIRSMSLNEGFEEGYQGINNERGQEVAKMILERGFTARTLESYLKDPEIWDQAFWGVIGGIGFGAAGRGLGNLKNKIQTKIDNKDIVDESKRVYRTMDDRTNTAIKNRLTKMEALIEQLNQIDIDNVLPEGYDNRYETNEKGEIITDEAGVPVLRKITEAEREQLKGDIVKNFLTDFVLDSIDAETFDAAIDFMKDPNFVKYFTDKGVTDQQLISFTGELVSEYAEQVRNTYEEFSDKVLDSKHDLNEFTALALARGLTRRVMTVYNTRRRANAIQNQLEQNQEYRDLNDKDAVEDYIKLKMINDNINSLENEQFALDLAYENGQFSKVAYNNYKKELRNKKLAYINSLNETTDRIDFKHSISKLIKEVNDRFQQDSDIEVYDNSINNILQALKQNINSYINNETNIENEHISEDLTKKLYNKASDDFNANYLETTLPKTKEDYIKEYDELQDSMSKRARDKKDKALERVSNYLNKAEDVNEAWNNILENKTNDAQLEKDLELLNLGYRNTYEYFFALKKLKDDIEKKRNKEANTATVAGREVTGQQAQETNTELEESRNEAEDSKSNEESSEEETTNDNEKPPVKDDSVVDDSNIEDDDFAYVDSGQGDEFAAEQEPDIDKSTEEYLAEQEKLIAEEEAKHTQQVKETYIPDDPYVSTEDVIQGVLMTQLMTPEAKQLFAKISHVNDAAFNELYKMMKQVAENENMGELKSEKIDKIIFDILKSIVTFYTKRNTNSRLENLLSELKLGGTFKVDDKDIVYTVFTNEVEINSVIESILDDYASQSNIYDKGKKVIKLDLLFDYIINNNDISYGEARTIFEHIKNYIDNNKIDKYIIDSAYFNKGKYTVDELIKTLDLKRKQISIISQYLHINRSNNTESEKIDKAIQLHRNNRSKYPIIIKKTKNAISFTINGVEIGYMSNAKVFTEGFNNGYIEQDNTFGLFNAVRKESDDKISSVFDRWLNPLTQINDTVIGTIEYLKRTGVKEEDIKVDDIINSISKNYDKDIIEFYKYLAEANQYVSIYGAKELLKKVQNNTIFKSLIEANGLKVNDKGKLEIANNNKAYNFFRIKDSSKRYVQGDQYDINKLTEKDYDKVTANLINEFNKIVFNQYSYSKWKENLYNNLSKTVEIQNELENAEIDGNQQLVADLVMSGVEVVNPGKTQIKNLSTDNGGHMTAKQNPLVFINDKDTRGTIEGRNELTNPTGFKEGTIGILSHMANGYPIIAPIIKMNKIYNANDEKNNSAFGIAVRNELLGAIDDWRAGKISLTELAETINYIGYSRTSPFGYGIITKVDGTGNILNIYRFPTNNERKKGINDVIPLATLYNSDKKKNHVTSIIVKGIEEDGSNANYYKAELDEKYNSNANYVISPTKVLTNYLLNYITFSNTFYPINHAAERYERTNPYFQKEESKYRVHFPKRDSIGSEFNESYDSFTDFYMKTNAAVVDAEWNEERGSYTDLGARWSGNGIYVTTSIQKKVNYTESELSDTGIDKDRLKTAFDKLKKDNQRVNVTNLLKVMNIDESVLDAIYKTKGIIVKQINYTNKNYNNANMVTTKDNNILLTNLGIKTILESTDPLNIFTRMIFHESLHKRLHETKANNFTEKQQKDLADTYHQFVDAVKARKFKIEITDDEYNRILNTTKELERIYGNILAKETNNEEEKQRNYNKFLEEWLVDSMTMKVILQAASIIEYNGTIEETKTKSKIQTIFDKIIEIISKIFGINTYDELKNSILVKQKSIFNKKNNKGNKEVKDTKKKTTKEAKETINEPSLFDNIEDDKKPSEITDKEVKDIESKIDKEINNPIQEETSSEQESITSDDERVQHSEEEIAALLAEDDRYSDDFYTSYNGENYSINIPAKEEAVNAYNTNRTLNPNGYSPIKNIDDFLKQYPDEIQPILRRMVSNGLIEYVCG